MQDCDFYLNLVENDLNPFFLFNSNGRIDNYNKEGEFLLNYVSQKELFDLAVLNASKSFGFKQKYINLKYNKYEYYAILVGYENEDKIALKLYKAISNQLNTINKDKLTLSNIFNLIDLSKKSTLINSKLQIKDIYDISIPDSKIDVHNFLLCLNSCFLYFVDDDNISLKIYIKTGEYEVINDTKYKIIIIEFISHSNIAIDNSIEQKAIDANINLFVTKNKLLLELPLIL